jgi:hypothetical protein
MVFAAPEEHRQQHDPHHDEEREQAGKVVAGELGRIGHT